MPFRFINIKPTQLTTERENVQQSNGTWHLSTNPVDNFELHFTPHFYSTLHWRGNSQMESHPRDRLSQKDRRLQRVLHVRDSRHISDGTSLHRWHNYSHRTYWSLRCLLCQQAPTLHISRMHGVDIPVTSGPVHSISSQTLIFCRKG